MTVSRLIVEERLLAGIKEQLMAPGAIDLFKQDATAMLKQWNAGNEQEKLERRLAELTKQRDNIMKAIKAGIITPTTKVELENAEHEIGGMQEALKQYERLNIAAISSIPLVAHAWGQGSLQSLSKII